ncbi:CPBP family intramembrane glutamic endopeptidase [Planomicrobium sp. CPCC 101079]|uniref:CPBP family intramembrane glutamic endopeptidase n=1 Tax=Planomicrobium sp. CPCC 101079 TaxID=2599618 RepID=UPI0011B3958D|nr:CPBP family intramembrane glutamic endopeptidase [Planomicrobium sp. CPCC 101079]TWT01774.1 CPBP family intramembrane metalloprotease [Planomicrobium sp. CPCC 101079]
MKRKSFWKSFLALFTFGLIGIIFFIPSLIPLVEEQLQSIPNPPDIPLVLLVLLSLINPLILLTIAVLAGLMTAPKVGLVSYLHLWVNGNFEGDAAASFKKAVPAGIFLGAAAAAVLFLLELAFQPYLPEALQTSAGSRSLLGTIGGISYGGITEELLLRWGMMSLFVWILWKLFQRSRKAPSAAIFWISILASALLFAVGHLGATALAAPLTAAVWARMLLLNGIAGLVFGWLYWRKGLEIAMVSHAFVHITTTLITAVWSLF